MGKSFEGKGQSCAGKMGPEDTGKAYSVWENQGHQNGKVYHSINRKSL
jgi:hypothetical protein